MFLCTLRQPWTKCLCLHCRAGKASRLHVKPGLSAVCITYLLDHPQGQLRAEFPGTPLRGKPWEWCSTLQCPLQDAPCDMWPGPRNICQAQNCLYITAALCGMSHTWWWAKKQSGTNGFCFMPGGRCEHGEAGLVQTAGFKVLLVLAASPCVYLIHSSDLGREFIGLMQLPQSSSYLTSSKVRKCLILFVN